MCLNNRKIRIIDWESKRISERWNKQFYVYVDRFLPVKNSENYETLNW